MDSIVSVCIACGDKIPRKCSDTFLATSTSSPYSPYCLIQSDGGGATGEEGEKFPCGECREEVKDDDEAIYCESGCEQWYHRDCTGMSKVAYDLLTTEDSAEWACNVCIAHKAIPMIKMVDKS